MKFLIFILLLAFATINIAPVLLYKAGNSIVFVKDLKEDCKDSSENEKETKEKKPDSFLTSKSFLTTILLKNKYSFYLAPLKKLPKNIQTPPPNFI